MISADEIKRVKNEENDIIEFVEEGEISEIEEEDVQSTVTDRLIREKKNRRASIRKVIPT